MPRSKRRRTTSIRTKRSKAAKKGWITRRRNARRRARVRKRKRRITRALPHARRRIVVRRRRRARAARAARARRPRSVRRLKERAHRAGGRLKAGARSAGAFSRAAKPTRRREITTVGIGAKGADPLNIQLSAKFHTEPNPTKKQTLDAYRFRVENGFDLPDVTTSIVRWRNPARKDPGKRGWREGDQDAAWETLGNAIRAWLEHQDDGDEQTRCAAVKYRQRCERARGHGRPHVVTVAGKRRAWWP